MVDVPLLPRTLSGAKIHHCCLNECQDDWSCLSCSTMMNPAVLLLHLGDAIHLLAVAFLDED